MMNRSQAAWDKGSVIDLKLTKAIVRRNTIEGKAL